MKRFESFKVEEVPHSKREEMRTLGGAIAKTLNEWVERVRPGDFTFQVSHSGHTAVIVIAYEEGETEVMPGPAVVEEVPAMPEAPKAVDGSHTEQSPTETVEAPRRGRPKKKD